MSRLRLAAAVGICVAVLTACQTLQQGFYNPAPEPSPQHCVLVRLRIFACALMP
jgi:hypothetical protein